MADPRQFNWEDLLELHVVRKLRHIVRSRFGIELSFASTTGAQIAGLASDSPCAPLATSAVRGAGATTTFLCAAHPEHGRQELAAPIVAEGVFFGCVYGAPIPTTEADFFAELVELNAEEISTFIVEMTRRDRRYDRSFESRYTYHEIVGKSRPMQELCRTLDKVVESDSTVLIQGENGTGKELIAKAIHFNSARSKERFVAQNCSAFNDNLLDSELFGHKKGAFTGAIADKQGLFELADHGTFFLDEIGDMSPALQVKILRVLQEGTLTPVGDTAVKQVDVRIIAATNRDLKRMVEEGTFREDLYYRINVINLTVPPLRERRDDILLLVDHFLGRNAKGRRLKVKRLSKECVERLLSYSWPGNIRELENEIERLVVLSGDDKLITEELLSPRIREVAAPVVKSSTRSLPAAVDALERSMIYEVLKRTQWNKTKAAEELQISRRNLIRKVSRYKLDQRRVR